MRNAILFLLLVNILAFVYERWIIRPDNPVEATSIQQDVPRLVRVQSPARVVSGAVSAAAVEKTQDADIPEYRCLRIGPFALDTDADKVRLNLERRAAMVRQTAEAGRVWVGHWVQVVGQDSRQQAERTRDALIRSGIRDAYIVSGADDNRISLGVYRQRASADRTVQRATSLGYETRIDDRYQPGTNFWLQARLPGDNSLQPSELTTDTGQILRTESIACE